MNRILSISRVDASRRRVAIKLRGVVFLAWSCLLGGPWGEARGSEGFGPKTDYAIGVQPASVEVADLNCDGVLDLALANQGSSTVSVLLGSGDGTFGASSDFTTGTGPTWAALGDLNCDGKPDLVATNQDANTVSVLLNTTPAGATNATFATKSDFATGASPTTVAIGDLDCDGKPDLAVANQGSVSVSVLLNTTAAGATTASFGAKTDFATGGFPFSVAVGDLNCDGALDLVTANYDANTVSVLLGNGDGSFGAKSDFATGDFPVWGAIGDLNRDGKPDLAVADAVSGTISVLLGNGDGTFAAKTDFATGGGPFSVAIGDVNRDGKLDLATANFDDHTVSVLLGDGSGGFGVHVEFATGTNPQSIAIEDLDRDGKADLTAANYNANTVSVLLGTTPFVDAPPGASVSEFALGPLTPNPSRGPARVQFDLPREAHVRLRVLDVMGRSVAVLADGVYPAGRHEVTWDKTVKDGSAPAGIYFVYCETGGKTIVRRVAMTR